MMQINMPKSWMRFTGIVVAALVGLAFSKGWIDEDMAKGIASIALGVFGVGVVKRMNRNGK